AVVLSSVRFRVSRGFWCSECCSGDATICVAGRNDQFLGFALPSHVVAPFRVRSGCICAHDHGRSAAAHSSTAQTDGKKPEQPHTAPALQRLLLFASHPAGTGTCAANHAVTQIFV